MGAVPDESRSARWKNHAVPECGAHVEQRARYIFLAPNSLSCKAQITLRIALPSRERNGIESLSEKTGRPDHRSESFDHSGVLRALVRQLGSSTASAQKARTCWSHGKEQDASHGAFLFAHGIPNVGTKTAKDLAKRFGTLSAVRSARGTISWPFLTSARSFGPHPFVLCRHRPSRRRSSASAIWCFPAGWQAVSTIADFRKTDVVTATLPSLGRREAEACIRTARGKAAAASEKNGLRALRRRRAQQARQSEGTNVPPFAESEFWS
jgi:DNA ligase (NAD+)